MSKEYTNYQEYLAHPKFKKIRCEVMTIAGGICQACKRKAATEVHHLKYPPWGEFDTPENLIAICHGCHCVKHGKTK